MKQKKT